MTNTNPERLGWRIFTRYLPEDYASYYSIMCRLLSFALGRLPSRPPSVLFRQLSFATFAAPVTAILVSCPRFRLLLL